jgi:L-amino acid N-acyltransferase YncA
VFVRLALESDEDTFVEISRLAVEESAPHVGFEPEVVRETFKNYLDTASPTIWLLDDNRKVIGFLLATLSQYRFSRSLFTTQEVLWIDPAKRRTQAAALLVRNLVEWSTLLGAAEITGGNDNGLFSENTARLLERFGFERVGIFMRCRVNGQKRVG